LPAAAALSVPSLLEDGELQRLQCSTLQWLMLTLSCRWMWEHWMSVLRCLRIWLHLGCSSLLLSIYLPTSELSATLLSSFFREMPSLRTADSIETLSFCACVLACIFVMYEF